MKGGRRFATWAARLVLAALFAFAGSLKLAGAADAVATFDRLGGGQWLRYLVGVCEVAGALGLLLTPLAGLAALGLASLMVGAVASHLLVLGPSPIPALAALGLALFVVWSERTNLRLLRQLRSGKGPMDGWIARIYDRGIQTAFRDLFPALSADIQPSLRGARRVLDVGCGPGQFTLLIAESLPGAEVCGVDLASSMIELARDHATTSPAATRVRFQIADVEALPFPDGTFDVVLSSGSIKQWPNPAAGLREIHRVLAPGGLALVAEMNPAASPETVGKVAARAQHWFMRALMPRVLTKSMGADEAAALFAASPFGGVAERRFLLDGFLWALEARRAAPASAAR